MQYGDRFTEDFALSRSHFQHLYSDSFRTSMTQDITMSRIQYAANLLKHSEDSVEEITYVITVSYYTR